MITAILRVVCGPLDVLFMEKSYLERTSPRAFRGFTLVELLVAVVIIILLAGLVVSLMKNAKKGARQATAMSQLREIGGGVGMWAAEKNNNEPMYFRDGTGDSSSEATPPLTPSPLCAGNPAMLLYDRLDPAQGYIPNHMVFFSPLHKYTAPLFDKYDPARASPSAVWGTYMWVYPSVPASERTPRQIANMRNSSHSVVGSEAYDQVMMFDDYSQAKAVYPKLYYALFRDGSVRKVAPNGDIWGWFKGTAK